VISLLLLQEYYEEYLHPHVYDYELSNGQRITLSFETEAFCHLLGVETVMNPTQKNRWKYSGNSGYEEIKNANVTLAETSSYDSSWT
jgi:hypothetical protein